MRDELEKEIIMLLLSAGVDVEQIKSRLVILLDNYEVSKRCTEISVCDEDDITHYVKLFLIGKRVAGRTDRTLHFYKHTLINFFKDVPKSPLEITPDDIKMFLATKEVRDGVGKVYQKNISRVLSSFFQWMQREEHITKNPMNKVDEIKTPKVRKEAFTELQVEQIRLAASGDARKECIVEVLLSTWCRVSELVQIKLSEISENGEAVTIHGKGNKDRICYLNARARLQVERYMSQRKDKNEYLFPKSCLRACATGDGKVFSTECAKLKRNPKDWWKEPELIGEGHADKGVIETLVRKLGKEAHVEKVHPHRFRRTGATFALRRGMPIEQVSKLLGHESIETTQIYLDISEQELAQAHEKYV